jgi:rhodanese-related sulfurtransferase
MNDSKVSTISVHELKKLREMNPDICIIDVREDNEWQEQHIPGALHIPKDEISTRIVKSVPDHNQPIYLHCRGGVRSMHAASYLLAMGYKDVYSVDGGIVEWEKSGYPVE